MSTETRCPTCGALFCECRTEKHIVKLNNCRCGGTAKLHKLMGRWFAVCGSSTCVRTAYGNSEENAQSAWNCENPSPATPPEDFEDFEDRFATAYYGSIGWFVPVKIQPNEVLAEFKDNFGFDLKEVAKEQWEKNKGN